MLPFVKAPVGRVMLNWLPDGFCSVVVSPFFPPKRTYHSNCTETARPSGSAAVARSVGVGVKTYGSFGSTAQARFSADRPAGAPGTRL